MKKQVRKKLGLVSKKIANLNSIYAGNGDGTGNGETTKIVYKCIKKSKEKVPVIVNETED